MIPDYVGDVLDALLNTPGGQQVSAPTSPRFPQVPTPFTVTVTAATLNALVRLIAPDFDGEDAPIPTFEAALPRVIPQGNPAPAPPVPQAVIDARLAAIEAENAAWEAAKAQENEPKVEPEPVVNVKAEKAITAFDDGLVDIEPEPEVKPKPKPAGKAGTPARKRSAK